MVGRCISLLYQEVSNSRSSTIHPQSITYKTIFVQLHIIYAQVLCYRNFECSCWIWEKCVVGWSRRNETPSLTQHEKNVSKNNNNNLKLKLQINKSYILTARLFWRFFLNVDPFCVSGFLSSWMFWVLDEEGVRVFRALYLSFMAMRFWILL